MLASPIPGLTYMRFHLYCGITRSPHFHESQAPKLNSFSLKLHRVLYWQTGMSWWGTVIAQLHLSPQKRGRTTEISWEDLERLELGGLCAVSALHLMTASRENKGHLSHQRLNLHKPHCPGVWEGPFHGYEHLCFPQSISAGPGILDPNSQWKCSPSIPGFLLSLSLAGLIPSLRAPRVLSMLLQKESMWRGPSLDHSVLSLDHLALPLYSVLGLPRWHRSKESACQCRRHKRPRSGPWSGNPLEEEMVTHSSILARRIPGTEGPDGLQSCCYKELNMTERLSTYSVSYSFLVDDGCKFSPRSMLQGFRNYTLHLHLHTHPHRCTPPPPWLVLAGHATGAHRCSSWNQHILFCDV